MNVQWEFFKLPLQTINHDQHSVDFKKNNSNNNNMVVAKKAERSGLILANPIFLYSFSFLSFLFL